MNKTMTRGRKRMLDYFADVNLALCQTCLHAIPRKGAGEHLKIAHFPDDQHFIILRHAYNKKVYDAPDFKDALHKMQQPIAHIPTTTV